MYASVPTVVCSVVSLVIVSKSGDTLRARPKSRILTCPVGVSMTLVGFKSGVDDADLVCRSQPRRNLCADAGNLVDGHRAAAQPLQERFARHKGHGDERLAGPFADLVDRCDAGMVQRACGLGLAKQAAHAMGIAGFFQELQRDFSA